MRIAVFYTLLAFLSPLCLQAEANVFISGKISNGGQVQKIEITVNEKYLTGDLTSYTGSPDREGHFAFNIDVREPQLISIRYGNKRGVLFLEPNDTLHIELNALQFPKGMQFGGKAGKNNAYLGSYYEKFPPELNQFKLKQYQTGNYWYVNTPDMDKLMLMSIPETFREKMDQRKQEAQSILDFQIERYPDHLSSNFKEFLNTEILYDWAYHLLLYGVVFKNKYGVTEEYFSFLQETPIDIPTIGNYWYREFLKGYFERLFISKGGVGVPELEKFKLAQEFLSDKALFYYQSEMIAKGFRSNEPMNMVGKYFDFTSSNPYPYFSEKAAANFEDAVKFANGSPAPDFSLTDAGGNLIALDQLRGNVVYLNFWASWCKPCIQKMENFKSIQPALEKKGVKFVNISLDKSKEAWASSLNRYNFNSSGIHLFANSEIESGIAAEYGVKILPQYYLVNKDGAFATKPKEKDVLAISQALDQLNNQN